MKSLEYHDTAVSVKTDERVSGQDVHCDKFHFKTGDMLSIQARSCVK